jgi:hypothetical protein
MSLKNHKAVFWVMAILQKFQASGAKGTAKVEWVTGI